MLALVALSLGVALAIVPTLYHHCVRPLLPSGIPTSRSTYRFDTICSLLGTSSGKCRFLVLC